MNVLHQIATARATAARENDIYHDLARLDARALADLGIERDQIAGLARIGAGSDARGIELQAALAQLAGTAQPERLTGLAGVVARLVQAAAATDLGRSLRLRQLWSRTFRRVRAELGSYSRRELMADLRRSPAEIDDLAAEAADERVTAFVTANPAYRHVALTPRAAA